MLKPFLTIAILLVVLLSSKQGLTETGDECHRGLGPKVIIGHYREPESWYGTEILAVNIPNDGIWPTTGKRGNAIAVKSVWWSSEFEREIQPSLKVSIRNLNGLPNDAVASNPHIADLGKPITDVDGKPISKLDGLPDDAGDSNPNVVNLESKKGEFVMIGIDFPSQGCWEITGEYQGQTLSFVVETVVAVEDGRDTT